MRLRITEGMKMAMPKNNRPRDVVFIFGFSESSIIVLLMKYRLYSPFGLRANFYSPAIAKKQGGLSMAQMENA
jgi:hypothetical protein